MNNFEFEDAGNCKVPCPVCEQPKLLTCSGCVRERIEADREEYLNRKRKIVVVSKGVEKRLAKSQSFVERNDANQLLQKNISTLESLLEHAKLQLHNEKLQLKDLKRRNEIHRANLNSVVSYSNRRVEKSNRSRQEITRLNSEPVPRQLACVRRKYLRELAVLLDPSGRRPAALVNWCMSPPPVPSSGYCGALIALPAFLHLNADTYGSVNGIPVPTASELHQLSLAQKRLMAGGRPADDRWEVGDGDGEKVPYVVPAARASLVHMCVALRVIATTLGLPMPSAPAVRSLAMLLDGDFAALTGGGGDGGGDDVDGEVVSYSGDECGELLDAYIVVDANVMAACSQMMLHNDDDSEDCMALMGRDTPAENLQRCLAQATGETGAFTVPTDLFLDPPDSLESAEARGYDTIKDGDLECYCDGPCGCCSAAAAAGTAAMSEDIGRDWEDFGDYDVPIDPGDMTYGSGGAPDGAGAGLIGNAMSTVSSGMWSALTYISGTGQNK